VAYYSILRSAGVLFKRMAPGWAGNRDPLMQPNVRKIDQLAQKGLCSFPGRYGPGRQSFARNRSEKCWEKRQTRSI